MKYPVLCLLAVLAAPVSAAPVHIALKPTAVAQPDADGFLPLASVADLSGGDKSTRARLSGVLVARAPLSGESRRLTRGDLALKLRQAGCNPDTQVVFDGAEQADVTAGEPTPARSSPPLPETGGERGSQGTTRSALAPLPPVSGGPQRSGEVGFPLIHRGDSITIYIQTGPLTITAPGIARENGGAGDTIRVHREGVMTDLSVQVLDAQTVRLEI